jgi:hypothetical protein
MPILSVCASIFISFGGAVWGVSTWKVSLENRLDRQDERLGNIEREHHVMVGKLDKTEGKLDKVMFRLRIPLDDPYAPEYHTWPQMERKGPDANLDKELQKLYQNDKHSRAIPPDPVLGLMQVPPPPQFARREW